MCLFLVTLFVNYCALIGIGFVYKLHLVSKDGVELVKDVLGESRAVDSHGATSITE